MSYIETELEGDTDVPANPVDLVEKLAALNDWAFERTSDRELVLIIEGRWAEYHASFQWMDDIEAFHLACAFDLKVPEGRRADALRLLAQVNEQLCLGHFDLWLDEGVVMYRHALSLAGGAEVNGRQCEALLAGAIEAIERYYPAFQFVIWAGKSAREAIDATLFETAGEA
jgi:hypothetical protein